MYLTKKEEEILDGQYSLGEQRSMELLTKYGDSTDAERMCDVASAHTMPSEPIDFLLRMTEGVERLKVSTTTHPLMSAFDPEKWKQMGVPKDFAKKELEDFSKRDSVYQKLGFLKTFTCMPFLVGNLPKKGDILSWIGSGAQLIANSVFGAKTKRDGTTAILASAIVGKTPYTGLLKQENRLADFLVELNDLDFGDFNPVDYQSLGYYIGSAAGNRNVIVEGLPDPVSFSQLKNLLLPLGVSGAVGICHVPGITPEAKSTQQALRGEKPEEKIRVGNEEIRETRKKMTTSSRSQVDLVIIGCPHCTISEIEEIARVLKGRRTESRLWIGAAEQTQCLANRMGYSDIIEKGGGVLCRSCMAGNPSVQFPEDVKTVATNSIKAAHYIDRLKKGDISIFYGSLSDCIDAGVKGEWTK